MAPAQWAQVQEQLPQRPIKDQVEYLKKLMAHYKQHFEHQKQRSAQQSARSDLEKAAAEAAKKVQVRYRRGAVQVC